VQSPGYARAFSLIGLGSWLRLVGKKTKVASQSDGFPKMATYNADVLQSHKIFTAFANI
jgi:hypothetical protein